MQLENYIPMLHSISNKFSHKTGLDRDDLFSEACLIALNRMNKYDSNRGNITTFLYTTLKYRLRKYASEQRCPKRGQMPIRVDRKLPDTSTMFTANVEEMQQSAKDICTMIFNEPEKYMQMNMHELTKHLLSIGWKWPVIRSAYKDIKRLLRT